MLGPLALIAAAAATPAAPADLAGIWEGNVGNLPVRACFVDREWTRFGAYYYLSRRRLIPLEAVEVADGGFREGGEGAETPSWRIERVDRDRLEARWTGNGRTLPVRLSRVADAPSEEGACASLAFHRPRLEGVRIVAAPASLEGVPYRRLTLATDGRFETSLETFALEGSGEAVGRINAELGRSLAGDPPGWFECIQNSLSSSPFEGAFDERFEPAMITGRWLSVSHHWDGFCGGAHPDSSNAYRTFDLSSGGEIDLHDWLRESAVKREQLEGMDEVVKTLQPAFRDVILQGWRAEAPECDEVVRGAEFWNIGLTREALIFSPSLAHVVQACWEEFPIPFARLRPFLTDEGAANLGALQLERAGSGTAATPPL